MIYYSEFDSTYVIYIYITQVQWINLTSMCIFIGIYTNTLKIKLISNFWNKNIVYFIIVTIK